MQVGGLLLLPIEHVCLVLGERTPGHLLCQLLASLGELCLVLLLRSYLGLRQRLGRVGSKLLLQGVDLLPCALELARVVGLGNGSAFGG